MSKEWFFCFKDVVVPRERSSASRWVSQWERLSTAQTTQVKTSFVLNHKHNLKTRLTGHRWWYFREEHITMCFDTQWCLPWLCLRLFSLYHIHCSCRYLYYQNTKSAKRRFITRKLDYCIPNQLETITNRLVISRDVYLARSQQIIAE